MTLNKRIRSMKSITVGKDTFFNDWVAEYVTNKGRTNVQVFETREQARNFVRRFRKFSKNAKIRSV